MLDAAPKTAANWSHSLVGTVTRYTQTAEIFLSVFFVKILRLPFHCLHTPAPSVGITEQQVIFLASHTLDTYRDNPLRRG
ncbi:MAG: hypothetical protein IPK30_03105 [Cellvibrionales bacterium]|nr:hypothetical protein [Cellvibrionales bacterium]